MREVVNAKTVSSQRISLDKKEIQLEQQNQQHKPPSGGREAVPKGCVHIAATGAPNRFIAGSLDSTLFLKLRLNVIGKISKKHNAN